MQERFKCFNVNFRLLKTIYVHLLVCYLNKLQNARCKDKDSCYMFRPTFAIFREAVSTEMISGYYVTVVQC